MARAAGWMGHVLSLLPDEQNSFPDPPPVKHEIKKLEVEDFFWPKVRSKKKYV